MIVFVNFYEKMATGVRTLAQMVHNAGNEVHLIVVYGDIIPQPNTFDDSGNDVYTLMNGRFHRRPFEFQPVSATAIGFLIQRLIELTPSMICLSFRARSDALVVNVLSAIKKHFANIPTICGGSDPSFDPLYYLQQGVDIVVRGEGEGALLEIVKHSKAGLPLTEIKNVCYLKDSQLVCNPSRPLVTDFSDIPFPLNGDAVVSTIDDFGITYADYSLLSVKEYFLVAGRGCILKCAYCAANALNKLHTAEGYRGQKYRKYSDERVFEELHYAKLLQVKKIVFQDEYLVGDIDKLKGFFKKYGEQIGLPFKAHFHHQQLIQHPTLLKTVLKAGLSTHAIGFQAGNENFSRENYYRKHSFNEMFNLSKILFHNFCTLQYHFVSGTSLNTEEEYQDKLNLIQRLPYDPVLPWRTLLFNFQFCPYPGSKMTNDYNAGKLTLTGTRQWAEKELLCQLRFIVPDPYFSEIAALAKKQHNVVVFLQNMYSDWKYKSEELHYEFLQNKLKDKSYIAYDIRTSVFDHRKYIVAKSKNDGVILKNEKVNTDILDKASASPELPILIFQGDALDIARTLRRHFDVVNPIFCIRAQRIEQ